MSLQRAVRGQSTSQGVRRATRAWGIPDQVAGPGMAGAGLLCQLRTCQAGNLQRDLELSRNHWDGGTS